MEKVCSKCGESKPLDQFPQPKNRPGPSSPCKACAVERVRLWREANPEKARTWARDAARRRREDPEHVAEEYERNNARVRAKSRAPRTVDCSRCGEPFTYTVAGRGTNRTVCDHCRSHDSEWRMYRLSGVQAEQLRAQGYCDICEGTEPRGHYNEWHIDHDHETGEIRGVLCAHCNTALGLLGDDPNRIRRAAEYLESHAARMVS